MTAREESTSEGGLSARCISLLEEVKEIIEGRKKNQEHPGKFWNTGTAEKPEH